LFHIVFPESKSAAEWSGCKTDSDRIRKYITLDAVKKGELEMAINHYDEEEKKKVEFEQNLQRAHGV